MAARGTATPRTRPASASRRYRPAVDEAAAGAAGPSRMPPSRLPRRLPLLAPALVALIAGLWAGLLRLGLDLPALRPAVAADHGILLVLGFLGTQIGLERAVALRRNWPYLVPAGAAAGALWLIVGLPAVGGKLLLAFAGAVLVAVFVVVHRIDATWHNAIMGLGAVAWAAGALAWLAGATIAEIVPFLAGFLILTIVGERLELARMGRISTRDRIPLIAAVSLFTLGVALSLPWPELGIRLAGIGMLAQALWLARHDIAKRTIRMAGVTRFMAVALLAGYCWLTLAGVLWLWNGELIGAGFAYDAMLHSIFLGFVFSMVFAHAPVIVPAVLEVQLPYRPVFYLPLAILHAGLVVRLLAGLGGDLSLWRFGGVLGELAIVLYLLTAVASAVLGQSRRRIPDVGKVG